MTMNSCKCVCQRVLQNFIKNNVFFHFMCKISCPKKEGGTVTICFFWCSRKYLTHCYCFYCYRRYLGHLNGTLMTFNVKGRTTPTKPTLIALNKTAIKCSVILFRSCKTIISLSPAVPSIRLNVTIFRRYFLAHGAQLMSPFSINLLLFCIRMQSYIFYFVVEVIRQFTTTNRRFDSIILWHVFSF